jgi:hypothetical protein
MTSAEAVEAGFDGINHITFPAHDLLHTPDSWLEDNFEGTEPVLPMDFTNPEARQQIALFQQHHTVFDDTAVLFELGSRPDSVPLVTLEPGSARVAAQLVESVNAPGVSANNAVRATQFYRSLVATIRELHKDGLVLVAGTDQAIPGYSLHRELEIYVQAGFTPLEALQAATILPAQVMGLDKELGTIEIGKRADMVVLDADPLKNIGNSRRIAKTIAGGLIYDPAPLWQSVGFLP